MKILPTIEFIWQETFAISLGACRAIRDKDMNWMEISSTAAVYIKTILPVYIFILAPFVII